MTLNGKTAMVTGGSRGLGLGLVEALVAKGVAVTVVARPSEALDALKGRGIATIAADVTDQAAAGRLVGAVKPDILVLNAGTPPPMGPIADLSWDDFSAPWETDVKGGLYWIQAALNAPLKSGARVLVTSSGAAVQGSPLSGGYAGAKRMLWLMAKYADKLSAQKGLGVRFQAIVPRQMVGGTGTGDAGARAYARAQGVTTEAFLAGFGAPLPPRRFGDLVVGFLENEALASAVAVSVRGDDGVTVLEEAA
jgi:NAD(P)-dependent dehydrogenase (short-subunit alcohol dehydrogenase family)